MNVHKARELTKHYIRACEHNPIDEIIERIEKSVLNKFTEASYAFPKKTDWITIKDCIKYFKLEGYKVDYNEIDMNYGVRYVLLLNWE